jgi:hypothetical protein
MFVMIAAAIPLFMVLVLGLLQSCGTTPPPATSPANQESQQPQSETVGETASSVAQAPIRDDKPSGAATEPPPQTVPGEIPPESIIGPPAADKITNRLVYDTVVSHRPPSSSGGNGWQYRKNSRGQIVGFDLSNRGGNRILPERYNVGKNKHFTRDFQFRFDDRARQDIHISITDWAPSRDNQFRLSGLMNSVMLLFPRRYVPAITTTGTSAVVILPTGEKIEFNAVTHEILSGVFAEAPVGLSAPRFPGVEYLGSGVTVRANSRGNDPRIATMATITTGSPDPNCSNGERCRRCEVPARELWEQNGALRFKFPTDEEFDQFLRTRCGFGLPQERAA